MNETSNFSTSEIEAEPSTFSINLPYIISELVVAVLAGIGNALTLYVFIIDRKLRRITNYYIASLALADFLVGVLGIPFAILVSFGHPRSLWPCLVMISSLIVLCAISILSLVAVSIDRYLAILHPIAYSRRMTKKVAKRIIWFCWFIGTIVGLLPAFGWYKETNLICLFVFVMDYNYLVFFYFAFIITPGILMSFFYAKIFSVVLNREKRYVRSKHGMLHHVDSANTKAKKELEAAREAEKNSVPSFTVRLRSFFISVRFVSSSEKICSKEEDEVEISSDDQKTDKEVNEENQNMQNDASVKNSKANKKEMKAAQNLSIIILFFFICWFPINTINCIQAFCPDCNINLHFLFFTIMLSHANSAVNPLIYAYNMKDFRRSLRVHVFKSMNFNRNRTVTGTSSMSCPSSTVQEIKLTPTISPKEDPMSLLPCLEISNSVATEFSKDERKYKFSSDDATKTSELKDESVVMPSILPYKKSLHLKIFSSDLRMLSFGSYPSLVDQSSFENKINRHYHSLEGKGDLLTPILNENVINLKGNKSPSRGRADDSKLKYFPNNSFVSGNESGTSIKHSFSQNDLTHIKTDEKI